jgi:hypothetical protein
MRRGNNPVDELHLDSECLELGALTFPAHTGVQRPTLYAAAWFCNGIVGAWL